MRQGTADSVKRKFVGLHQTSKGAELAKAHLIRKPFGYYLHVKKVARKIREKQANQPFGIDLGIKHLLNLLNGEKLSAGFIPALSLWG